MSDDTEVKPMSAECASFILYRCQGLPSGVLHRVEAIADGRHGTYDKATHAAVERGRLAELEEAEAKCHAFEAELNYNRNAQADSGRPDREMEDPDFPAFGIKRVAKEMENGAFYPPSPGNLRAWAQHLHRMANSTKQKADEMRSELERLRACEADARRLDYAERSIHHIEKWEADGIRHWWEVQPIRSDGFISSNDAITATTLRAAIDAAQQEGSDHG